jgi:hypothetical protein
MDFTKYKRCRDLSIPFLLKSRNTIVLYKNLRKKYPEIANKLYVFDHMYTIVSINLISNKNISQVAFEIESYVSDSGRSRAKINIHYPIDSPLK